MSDVLSKSVNSSQLYHLKDFGHKVNILGGNFAFYDISKGLILLSECSKFKSDQQQLIKFARQILEYNSREECCDDKEIRIWRFGEGNIVVATVLESTPLKDLQAKPFGVALIDMGDESLDLACDASCETNSSNLVRASSTYLMEMLKLLVEKLKTIRESEVQIEMLSTELAKVYEELVLLHKLSINMKVTESDANFLQIACDSLTDIVLVEGIAILLEKTVDGEKKFVIAAGSGLIDIDERMAGILHSRLTEEIDSGKEALLDSEVDSPFKYDWPKNIKNIIAVPLCGKDKTEPHLSRKSRQNTCIIGVMVAINRIDKQDFDSTDVKLFDSVASSCAVFIENGRLFNDLKELFIGSLKALTSSIDAKDQYTRGHSERVAIISRWIAERISEHKLLQEEQIHKIYLAGLLHDIGKIGIEENVLRKSGILTNEERECMRKHPSIGAGILRGIKQMRDIVPGVLCHHERIDGNGYPDGLTGEEIPLTGKIVGLADSFDAMTSKRSYREAKTVEQALEEVEKGLGTQFDKKIGRIFLDSDVYQLWDIMQNGLNEIYGTNNFSEYGTAAVGTLIR